MNECHEPAQDLKPGDIIVAIEKRLLIELNEDEIEEHFGAEFRDGATLLVGSFDSLQHFSLEEIRNKAAEYFDVQVANHPEAPLQSTEGAKPGSVSEIAPMAEGLKQSDPPHPKGEGRVTENDWVQDPTNRSLEHIASEQQTKTSSPKLANAPSGAPSVPKDSRVPTPKPGKSYYEKFAKGSGKKGRTVKSEMSKTHYGDQRVLRRSVQDWFC